MEVITIESKAFKQLMEKLEAVSEYVYAMAHPADNDDEKWVDSGEVCHFLKISERTLQRLRTNGKITYSQISQIKKLLTDHLIKSSDECMQSLIDHHRQYMDKRK